MNEIANRIKMLSQRVNTCVLLVIAFQCMERTSASPIDWCEVGEVGNVAFPGNVFSGAFAGRGQVAYPFRIARTEITTAQYLSFVIAYAPFYSGSPTDIRLTGSFIQAVPEGDGYRYVPLVGFEQVPTNMSLRMAARFANWLHNGQISDSWAFDSGVYDASTFFETSLPDGTPVFHDDYTRSGDARYWIPNLDEWLKAVYFGQDRFGVGNAGWWMFPNSTNEPLQIGEPGGGGQTNGSLFSLDPAAYLQAGSYPTTISPWGLLDASGGISEITENRWAFGSSFFTSSIEVPFADEAGIARTVLPVEITTSGLRLASAVPSPASIWLIACVVFMNRVRKDI